MGKWVNSVVLAVTLGMVDMNKDKKASGAQASSLEDDKKNDTKKRKALYGTQGGVLGQEVNQVGYSNRGNIFGN